MYKGEITEHGNGLGHYINQNDPVIIEANDKPTVIVQKGNGLLRDAEMHKDGADLVLETAEGQTIIQNYYGQETTPDLMGSDGIVLTPKLVQSFLKSDTQYAQVGSASDESPVGNVQEFKGEVTITRLDGSVEIAEMGSSIYEGDVIETSSESSVNLVFIDETSFAVSKDARLSIDEYVFDPASNEGSNNFSVLKGIFVFTSGLIGREDPDDISIETPMGSIGIRGTIIAGNADSGEVTVIEGAIVLRDFHGNELTLADQFETAIFEPAHMRIRPLGQLSAEDVGENFESVSGVAGALFSSIDDAANDTAPANDQVDGTPDLEAVEGAEDTEDAINEESSDDSDNLGDVLKDNLMQEAGSNIEAIQQLNSVQSNIEFILQAAKARGIDVEGLEEKYLGNLTLDTAPVFIGFNLARSGGPTNSAPVSFQNQEGALRVPTAHLQSIENNTWIYDFSQEFFDADGDIIEYALVDESQTLLPALEAGMILSYDLDSVTGVLTIAFGPVIPDLNVPFRIGVEDSVGQTDEININFTLVDSTSPANSNIFEEIGNPLTGSGQDVYLRDNDVNDFDVSGDNNTIRLNESRPSSGSLENEGRTVKIEDGADNNTIFGGSRDDTIIVESAIGTKIHGFGGNDTVAINLNTVDLNSTSEVAGLEIDLNEGLRSWGEAFTEGATFTGSETNGDTLVLSGADKVIDFSNVSSLIKNIETLNVNNATSQTLDINLEDVFSITDGDNTLVIRGDATDQLNLLDTDNNDSQVATNTGTIDFDADDNGFDETYNIWEGVDSGGNDVTLLVESNVGVTVI